MNWVKKKNNVVINENNTTNEFINTEENVLLNKLRFDVDELKKLNPKEPYLRHTLNDFLLKHGYSSIPSHMRLFEEFFSAVDRDYMYDFSASRSCKITELDCVIEILQKYRNEIAEMYDVIKREHELKEEIKNIKEALKIE